MFEGLADKLCIGTQSCIFLSSFHGKSFTASRRMLTYHDFGNRLPKGSAIGFALMFGISLCYVSRQKTLGPIGNCKD